MRSFVDTPDLMLIYKGVKIEEYEKSSTMQDSKSMDNIEFQMVLGLIKDGLKVWLGDWSKKNSEKQGTISALEPTKIRAR